ncbi:AraC family transcriptional regulator [Dongia mobilis]|uniref:AraC family transcriptional regulator n=2 Tax=Dongia mobilis TaxID=578943 RepID=A0A4R6WKU3_9PROT|nr:AraC family transcriptional regulator [Dongia mobilis]
MLAIGKLDILGIILAMKLQILALDGVFDTGLAALLDVFATANELVGHLALSVAPFEVRVVGLRRRVKTALGFSVPIAGPPAPAAADWMVMPAIGYKMPQTLVPALARADVGEATAVLREARAAHRPVAAACIGTFVLAESGALDGERATTTWWLAPLFRERYPNVRLDEGRMLVRSGDVVTAGAALSHMDLALWLVRQASPELAGLVARYLIVDSRPAQSAYVVSDHLAHSDPLVEKFERWARRHLAEGFSLDAAADAIGASKRTLARRLQAVLGKTPLTYVQDLRIERALHLLRTSSRSLGEIAAAVGYADEVTLRNLLRRRLGRGIREMRLSD